MKRRRSRPETIEATKGHSVVAVIPDVMSPGQTLLVGPFADDGDVEAFVLSKTLFQGSLEVSVVGLLSPEEYNDYVLRRGQFSGGSA